MAVQSDVARYRANWQDEVDSATLYRVLAEIEARPQLAELYQRLSAAEFTHVGFWEEQLRAAGRDPGPRQSSWRARMLAVLARRFGPQFVLPTLVGREQIGGRGYAAQPEVSGGPMVAQEQSHARLLSQLASPGVGEKFGMEGSTLAQLEGRHRASSGNALRAAVLGANDGLLSNFSLVMGVAGADLAGRAILITGLAGLLAGAGSMAMGEWISVQSSRELYQRQIAIEKVELAEHPEEEAEELALIYGAKGLAPDAARELARRIIGDQATALDTLAREELAIDPEELGGSAWEAAITSFVLFAIGAIIPVLPFIFLSGLIAVAVSIGLSAAALFLIGAAITLMTGRSILFSGARQVGFGLAAAALTYVIGRLIGGSIGG